jgi:sugar lactone lactonase YvrE
MAGQDFQQWHVTEPYLETHCSLGEGPFYEPATNTLRFVDIIKKQLHTVSLTEGPSSLKTLQFDEGVTVTADIEGRDPQDALLIGAKQGLAVLDRKTGKYEYVTKFDQDGVDRIRSNDGAVDPHGRFWLGTMTDFGKGDFRPEGEFSVFAVPSIESRGAGDGGRGSIIPLPRGKLPRLQAERRTAHAYLHLTGNPLPLLSHMPPSQPCHVA